MPIAKYMAALAIAAAPLAGAAQMQEPSEVRSPAPIFLQEAAQGAPDGDRGPEGGGLRLAGTSATAFGIAPSRPTGAEPIPVSSAYPPATGGDRCISLPGGKRTQVPINNLEYRIVCRHDSVVRRFNMQMDVYILGAISTTICYQCWRDRQEIKGLIGNALWREYCPDTSQNRQCPGGI